MFGVFLVTLSTLIGESGDSFGKLEVKKKEEGVFTMGFINLFMTTVLMAGSLLVGQKFIVSSASYPTLFLELIFAIIQTHVAIKAVVLADRSTFSFFRILTVPLLVVVDLVLGYKLKFLQILGIGVIIIAMLIASYKNILNTKGAGLVIFTAVNSVFTASLYKYNITHFNSVVGNALTVQFVVLVYLFVMLLIKKEGNLRSLLKPKFFIQSSSEGLSNVLESFSYFYAPASIIISAKRATSMLWSTIAGWKYFGESNLIKKLVVCTVLVIGVCLLV